MSKSQCVVCPQEVAESCFGSVTSPLWIKLPSGDVSEEVSLSFGSQMILCRFVYLFPGFNRVVSELGASLSLRLSFFLSLALNGKLHIVNNNLAAKERNSHENDCLGNNQKYKLLRQTVINYHFNHHLSITGSSAGF